MKIRSLIVMVLVTVGVLSARPMAGHAQVTRIVVEVDGLSCPFCAYSLEKRIKRLDAVGDLAIEVDDGLAVITPLEGKQVDFDGLPEVVRAAGFTPREIRVEGTARVESRVAANTVYPVRDDGRGVDIEL